ncbi:MAG: hypothetical protein NTW42_02085 [Deltaproteobacteria bacterium]|nr:hypothetical protein [Deltaproteobacteria bacterium]
MDMTQVKEKAKQLGIQVGKMKKVDLIRAIQSKEGNFPCFETAKDYCSQLTCAWRKACLPSKEMEKKHEQTKNLYLKKIKAELETLTNKLADLKKKSQKTMGAGKTEALAEIHKLEKKIEDLKKNAHGLATASEDAWEITKQGVDKAWKGLRDSAKKALAKFS